MANSSDDTVGCLFVVGLLMFGVWSCSGDKADEHSDTYDYAYSENGESYGSADYEEAPAEFDEDAARQAAEEELADEPYDGSYGCTIDCSGHEAGWQWRAENGYPTYGSDDYGKSQSFAEGARAYEDAVEERVDEMRSEFESGDEVY